MSKYIVETFYTCSFKIVHKLDELNEKKLSELENRNDGEVQIIDVKLNNRKTKTTSKKDKFEDSQNNLKIKNASSISSLINEKISTSDKTQIENQLEKTDHKHLGQLLTYATGLDAVTIVWIAKEFNDEHKETLDWLNKITDDNHNFFGVKIEVIKIRIIS